MSPPGRPGGVEEPVHDEYLPARCAAAGGFRQQCPALGIRPVRHHITESEDVGRWQLVTKEVAGDERQPVGEVVPLRAPMEVWLDGRQVEDGGVQLRVLFERRHGERAVRPADVGQRPVGCQVHQCHELL
jgi:hypothetical protein